jgi:hypothetical protein
MIHLIIVDMDGHLKSTRSYPASNYSGLISCELGKLKDDSQGAGLITHTNTYWENEFVASKECVKIEVNTK